MWIKIIGLKRENPIKLKVTRHVFGQKIVIDKQVNTLDKKHNNKKEEIY